MMTSTMPTITRMSIGSSSAVRRVIVFSTCSSVGVRDAAEHALELAALLADLDHRRDHAGELAARAQRNGERRAFDDAGARLVDGLGDHGVVGDVASDLERLHDADAAREQCRQRAREARDREHTRQLPRTPAAAGGSDPTSPRRARCA